MFFYLIKLVETSKQKTGFPVGWIDRQTHSLMIKNNQGHKKQ